MKPEFPKPSFWVRILIFFENLWDRARRSLENAAEFLEWGLVPAFGLLARPFRWLMQSRVVELTERAQGAIELQTSSISVHMRDFFTTWLSRIFPRRLFTPFYWLIQNTYWLFDFFNAWFYTRERRKLLGALPAVMFGVPLFVVLLLGRVYSTSAKISHYDRARREALQEKDQARADFLLARLKQLRFRQQDRANFDRAMALMEAEQKDEAIALLHELAPADAPKYAKAHLYLAAALMEGTVESEDPWPLVERHAGFALQLEPDHPLARRLIVECQLQSGQVDLALPTMEELRRDFPDLNAELAHVYAGRGDMPVARKFASQAVKYWERIQGQVEADSSAEEPAAQGLLVTSHGYLRFAEAFGIMGDDGQMLELLREGASRYPDASFLQQAYVGQLSTGLQNRTVGLDEEPDDQWQQVKDLLVIDPGHEKAAQMLYTSFAKGDAAAMNVAAELLADDRSPARLYKLLGDIYLSTERTAEAKLAYQRACEKDDQSAYAWNNLAWIFSNTEPVDLERALQCTQYALDAKQDPNFYETRGQILVKLERWEEAARSLERALNGAIPNPQDAHRSLATIYTALGKPEQAAAHRTASGQ